MIKFEIHFGVIGSAYNPNRPMFVCWLNEWGRLHRDNGPAFECCNGQKKYFKNGVCEKIILSSGEEYNEY